MRKVFVSQNLIDVEMRKERLQQEAKDLQAAAEAKEKEADAARQAVIRNLRREISVVLPVHIIGPYCRFAAWWDQFASTEVGGVEGISGAEIAESAEHVATALRAWHEAGTAAGDVAFWRGHVERFRSPKAYALVVEALLEQRDPVAAMAVEHGWRGVVVNGCVRDSAELAALPLGVLALATHPRKSRKQGRGRTDVIVAIAGISIAPGNYLYADEDGVIVATRDLLERD